MCWAYNAVIQTLTNGTVPQLKCARIDPTNPFTTDTDAATATADAATDTDTDPATPSRHQRVSPSSSVGSHYQFDPAEVMCPAGQAGAICRGALKRRRSGGGGGGGKSGLQGSPPLHGATPNYTCVWDFQ